MSTSIAPLVQIRVIGPTGHATELLTRAAEQARRLYGLRATYRTQTRTARRAGYIRAYLTVTPERSED